MFKGFSIVLGLVVICAVAGCASTQVPEDKDTASPASSIFIENVKCGNAFYADGWASGYKFAYEVLDKTSEGNGFKVKTMANVDGRMIHLDCTSNLLSKDAALAWLIKQGYGLSSDGAEAGGAGGLHRTVDRGPLYKIPANLYK